MCLLSCATPRMVNKDVHCM